MGLSSGERGTARQGRVERADGPRACRPVAACRRRRGSRRVSGRRGDRAEAGAWPCPPTPLLCAATLVPVPLSSARPLLPGFVSAPTRGGAAGYCPPAVRHASAAIGGGVVCRWPMRPGGALTAGAAVRPFPVGAGVWLPRRKHCGGPLRWRALRATGQAPVLRPQRAGREDPHRRPRSHDRERAGNPAWTLAAGDETVPHDPILAAAVESGPVAVSDATRITAASTGSGAARCGRAARPDGVQRSPAADERGHQTARL